MREKAKRTAKSTRPQLVCVLADNSLSMKGPKAQSATEGIREMIMECQTRGRDMFQLLLIRFSDNAEFDSQCDMVSANKVDSDAMELLGDGHLTNITHALELAHDRLKPYVSGLQSHPEKEKYPLPIVILFSDGEHNVGPGPQSIASKIKQLNVDGDPVLIVTAAVNIDGTVDEKTLKEIATQTAAGKLYVTIRDTEKLAEFLAEAGSSTGAKELEKIVERINKEEPYKERPPW